MKTEEFKNMCLLLSREADSLAAELVQQMQTIADLEHKIDRLEDEIAERGSACEWKEIFDPLIGCIAGDRDIDEENGSTDHALKRATAETVAAIFNQWRQIAPIVNNPGLNIAVSAQGGSHE